MTTGETPRGYEASIEYQPSYMFIGENIAFTDEQREILERTAGEFLGRQVSLVAASCSLAESALEVPEQVQATQETYREFAVKHGYTKQMADLTWNMGRFTTHYGAYKDSPEWPDPYPKLRYLDDITDILDLRSAHKRLVASDQSPNAWSKGTRNKVRFLAHIVNERVQPEELLYVEE